MAPARSANAEDVAKEWEKLVEPALPKVQQKLRDNLLFDAIWDHVLDDRARRMLYRMTLLRVPWTWDLMPVLGEPDESPDVAEGTAERLRSTSLLEQVDLPVMGSEGRTGLVPYFTLHPATVQFITHASARMPLSVSTPTAASGNTWKPRPRPRPTSRRISRPGTTCSRRESTIGRTNFLEGHRIGCKVVAAFARG